MIPKVSKEALEESIKNIMPLMNPVDNKERDQYLKNYGQSLKDNQPEILQFIYENIEASQKINNGKITNSALFTIAAIIINSLYIQEEMNEVNKLFEGWDD